MHMKALVLESSVNESTFYDQSTGAPRPGYSVDLVVLDAETKEKYNCRLTSGFARLDELKDRTRRGEPMETLRELAGQLQQELPPDMTPLMLEVLKFTGKNAAYIKLVCRLVQA